MYTITVCSHFMTMYIIICIFNLDSIDNLIFIQLFFIWSRTSAVRIPRFLITVIPYQPTKQQSNRDYWLNMCIYNAQSHAEKVQSILHKIGGQSDSHRILKRRIKTHEAVYILYIHNFSSKSGFQTNIYLMIYCPKIK